MASGIFNRESLRSVQVALLIEKGLPRRILSNEKFASIQLIDMLNDDGDFDRLISQSLDRFEWQMKGIDQNQSIGVIGHFTFEIRQRDASVQLNTNVDLLRMKQPREGVVLIEIDNDPD